MRKSILLAGIPLVVLGAVILGYLFINTKEAHKWLVGNTLRGSELEVLQGIEKAEEVKII
jgi:hypothetical protein